MRTVIFVAPFPMAVTLRFARALAKLPNVKLLGVFQSIPRGADAALFHDVFRVDNALHTGELLHAVGSLAAKHGKPHRVLGVLENLQVQLARVREHYDIPGLDVQTAMRFRDKNLMKDALRTHGVPCARHAMVETRQDARDFIDVVGFPIVLKPPAGAGCKATYRVDNEAQLVAALDEIRPAFRSGVLAEEFLTGEEYSLETMTLNGEVKWWSSSRYYPTPLEAMRNPHLQWVAMLPRDVEQAPFTDALALAQRAISALGLETSFTHMEWFRRPDGTLAVGEIAARPPGAMIVPMNGFAYDRSLFLGWARLMVDDHVDRNYVRKYSVGTAFLRGPGTGRVSRVDGIEEAQKIMGHLVVDAKLPRRGMPKSDSYEGDGYAIVRHPDTEVVKKAVFELISRVKVRYA